MLLAAVATASMVVMAAKLDSYGERPVDIGSLPEFTGKKEIDWINSQPVRVRDLLGNVVLIDFWTFECWNCYRSIPWLNEVEQKFSESQFKIIGIHTPEFERERVRSNVEAKVKEYSITHPVMMDNDFRYWRALGNRYWPSFYLIDKKGIVRYNFVGETHSGDKRARLIENAISELLQE